MARKTAVIDLGSNSVRMVIFEKSSRFAFNICAEYKRKVRLGENAYNNGKVLQAEAMQRTEDTLAHFKALSLKHKCNKLLIVGTSALRDAPNSKDFIKRIKNKLKLNIRCIDGKTESYLGGLAALNLLSDIQNATTLDIGGGSSELCLIRGGKIVDYISLDIGTVRLKELFSDKDKLKDLDNFFKPLLKLIPESFKNEKLIAIGGSLRALSNSIMQKNSYPLKTLHNFHYELKNEKAHIKKILACQNEDLANYGIKKDRFDTIKEGILIFLNIAETLGAKEIITSGVGVREGVFLQDLLPKTKSFPVNFNPSLRSLQDRFLKKNHKSKISLYCSKIFDELQSLHDLNISFKTSLINASKLYHIGEFISPYYSNEHSAYLVLNNLDYRISHKEKTLIAHLIKFSGKKINSTLIKEYQDLLPKFSILAWLSFILGLAKILEQNCFEKDKIQFKLKNKSLYIYSQNTINIPKDELKKLVLPEDLILVVNQVP
ncbi:Ppx/GppA family phosphatase [Campylobacter sp. MIT 99-7217]|uniref:Ppx/GppA phosphatase family protein n=1 Tax=Campylobacter sp. MIT 99-7217 TaxID=535091 RepID=UPI001159992A|nr:Ppx/GppA phosphatase family protein [Campylobacter sp. MIT 99-7217]TQR33115.1 Ppx/GppA family phosphatase [Campylobacter sp. MIT 99-7217]